MSRALLVLYGPTMRAKASKWIADAPDGTRVEFKAPRRSLDQNSRMWAMLTEFASQLPWHGNKLTPDDWKLIFLAALKRETKLVPNIDGDGFVDIGRSSSDLSKEEMTDLIELMFAFGAKNNIKFHEPQEKAA